MINLKNINDDNFWPVIKLKSNDNEVASNLESLAEAYLHVLEEESMPITLAIYNDDEVVGFTMANHITAEEAVDEEEIDADHACYWISRFMICEDHQRKGYGRQAFGALIDYLKNAPQGEADAIYVSVVPESVHVAELYKSFGFYENGRFCDDEIVLRLDF
jgi:diamine N-acetyltransferase